MKLFSETVSWLTNRRNKVSAKRIFFKKKLKRSTLLKTEPPKKAHATPFSRSFAKAKSKLSKGTKEHFLHDGSFYDAVGSVLAMAQVFSIMPVNNIKANGASDLYFSWWTFRTIYSVVFILLTILFNVIVVLWCFSDQIDFDKIVPLIFCTSSSYARICFIILAIKWPALMQQWHNVEKKLPQFESIKERLDLAYKIKIASTIIMTLSLVEHLLNIISIVSHSNACSKNQTHPIEDYFRIEQNQIYYFFEFTPILAFLGKMINISSVFVWSYMDLFVIVISLGLSGLLKQLNRHLTKHKGQKMAQTYWIENRVNYRNICRLCESIDKAIGPITIVSFANNLYFVCIQLLKSLNPMPSAAHSVYFWFSLVFLITRTLAVSLYSSAVNDESKAPIQFFRACPAEGWCLEVKRFCAEVTNDIVALSGMRFFYLTRKLVLSVVGTIITYELVLIQFRKISDVPADIC